MDAAIVSNTAKSSADAGFSLIEVLVVVAVLSLLAVSATLALGRSGAQGPDDLARFQTAYNQQRDLAVQGQRMRGLTVRRELRLARPEGTGWQSSEAAQGWQGRALFQRVHGLAAPGAPDIVFLPDGRSTAFDISFFTGSESTGRCASDGWTGLTCARQ